MLTVSIACTAGGLAGVGCGSEDSSGGPPSPVPAFYLTASSASDLRHQAYDAAARFAKKQGPGNALLMLDFGAARRHRGSWGVSLRSGTFFSNDEVHSALQAAAQGYHDKYRQGEVTIVYVNSNANLGDPGHRFQAFNRQTAHEAGEEQAKAIRDLHLYPHESTAVGGDIEPGYDLVGSPEVSIELVAGAAAESGGPYYDIGTAPCRANRCVNGWTPRDICAVASGGGRQALPEVYFAIQAVGWANVQKQCGIKAFAGASASPVGDLDPRQSWRRLGEKTGAEVGDALVVWPG